MNALRSGRRRLWLALASPMLIVFVAGCGSRTITNPAIPTPDERAAGSASEAVQVTRPQAAQPQATQSPTTPILDAATAQTAPPAPAPTQPTQTPAPVLTPTQAPLPTVTATPTPAPALRQLTDGGCCTQPFWSADSQRVLFIDKPVPNGALGIWAVDTSSVSATPELITERIAFYTSDFKYAVVYGGAETAIEQLDEATTSVVERWTVPADGRPIDISPNRTRIAWVITDSDVPFERRVAEIWIANFDGSGARPVATVPRGGVAGWVSDDVLLLSGRESLQSAETVIYTFSLIDGGSVELVRAEQPRGWWVSPDGRWMIYYVTFSDDPDKNGLWVVRTDGSERRRLDAGLFGDYEWRDAQRLLIIPFRLDAEYQELWEYDVETGVARQLTDPGVTPFKVANGDWRVSPDGRYVVFVETRDRSIWLLTLND